MRVIIYFMIVVIFTYPLFQMHNQSFHYLCFKQKTNKKLNKQIRIITQEGGEDTKVSQSLLGQQIYKCFQQ